VPEQAVWSPAVSIGKDAADFCAHIARLLDCDCDDGLSPARLNIAREHTWPRLAERLWDMLHQPVFQNSCQRTCV
jgi:hypothetical protein